MLELDNYGKRVAPMPLWWNRTSSSNADRIGMSTRTQSLTSSHLKQQDGLGYPLLHCLSVRIGKRINRSDLLCGMHLRWYESRALATSPLDSASPYLPCKRDTTVHYTVHFLQLSLPNWWEVAFWVDRETTVSSAAILGTPEAFLNTQCLLDLNPNENDDDRKATRHKDLLLFCNCRRPLDMRTKVWKKENGVRNAVPFSHVQFATNTTSISQSSFYSYSSSKLSGPLLGSCSWYRTWWYASSGSIDMAPLRS